MVSANVWGFVTLFVLSVGIAMVVYAVVRRSLRSLLDETIRVPSGTTFYSRILFIGLLFLALYSAIGTPFDLKEEAPFMEYVWKIAGALSTAFALWCLFLAAYLVVVTILAAALRRRNE